jgi:hypothetical protein
MKLYNATIAAGFDSFTLRGTTPIKRALFALDGRSPWAKSASFHNSRIVLCETLSHGAILAILESTTVGMDRDSGRVFNSVFFDPAGRVIPGPWERKLSDCPRSRSAGIVEFRQYCANYDFEPAFRAFLEREKQRAEYRAAAISEVLKGV